MRTPQAAGHSPHVEAYQRAFPGTSSSGALTYGMTFSTGRRAQPAAANTAPAPSSLRNSRRDVSVPTSEGVKNSRSRRASTSGDPSYSPRDFQYRGRGGVVASLMVSARSHVAGGAVGRRLLLPVTVDAPAHLQVGDLPHDLEGVA